MKTCFGTAIDFLNRRRQLVEGVEAMHGMPPVSHPHIRYLRYRRLAETPDSRHYDQYRDCLRGAVTGADILRVVARHAWSRDQQLTNVYFVGAGEHLPIKIGKADDPHNRLASLQTGSPAPLELLAVLTNVVSGAEAILHEMFKPLRLHGEWFARSPELLDWIGHVRSGVSQPIIGTVKSISKAKRMARRKADRHRRIQGDVWHSAGEEELLAGASETVRPASGFLPERPFEDFDPDGEGKQQVLPDIFGEL